MRNVVCPQCQENVAVPADLTQAHCVRCGQLLGVAEAVVDSSSSHATGILAAGDAEWSPTAARAFETGAPTYSDWEDFRSNSPVVQRTWAELAMKPLPDLRAAEIKPLPSDLPEQADHLGLPVAWLHAPGEDRFLMHCLSAVIILVFSIVPPYMVYANRKHQGTPLLVGALVSGFSVVGGLAGAYYVSFRRSHKWEVDYWILERGILWQRGDRAEACTWEDIQSMHLTNDGAAPQLRLQLAPEFTATIAGTDRPEWMPLMEFIATKVTAAQCLSQLRRIHDGERVRFGAVVLDREGFHAPRFHAPWSEIVKVVADPLQIFVHCKGQTTWHGIRYADVSFPHLVIVIAHILSEEHGRLPALDS